MIRTQIYLTEHQRNKLTNIAKIAGKNQSELIREAVDSYIDRASTGRREKILNKAAGIWHDRTDLPDFNSIRAEWDRS